MVFVMYREALSGGNIRERPGPDGRNGAFREGRGRLTRPAEAGLQPAPAKSQVADSYCNGTWP